MNTKLEKIFDLSPSNKEEEIILIENNMTQLYSTSKNLDQINAALPMVSGLSSDEELDELAAKATEGYEQLLELGMSTEIKYAAEIFSAASNMLGHAITAKKNKIEKKLKMIELQLKKLKIDKDSAVEEIEKNNNMTDRNALVDSILSKMQAFPPK